MQQNIGKRQLRELKESSEEAEVLQNRASNFTDPEPARVP